ncbi:trypsin-like peptidase domain-containing protein [Gimesia panareensis]|uniref:Serine protease Do-like HtrA n=1 Tax=Gimesia panareensis TaxID=2527978 RepID=A0A518ADC8_9PLAN|nr:trypsin-like peptidase domain-containing protein [Gimesia panareensis]QDT29663.1 Serine protease Do-like HtrA [Gimesia panareensis]QDU52704.1 Serine protease Do-like HtrA [Gimesia panareensis]
MNSDSESVQHPDFRIAGEREAGVKCARCNQEVRQGELTARCTRCGAIHHQHCWMQYQCCGSYQCSQGSMSSSDQGQSLVISRDDLNQAEPLPVVNSYTDNAQAISEKPKQLWNKLALTAFIVALIGIPLFGILTGLIAMILGCIALVSHPTHKKGFALAVLGLLIGFVEMIGWSVGLYHFYGNPQATSISLNEYAFDDSALENMPDYLKRAMQSNVLIQVSNGLLSQGMGSGVILKKDAGQALIVTNRHVIDHDFNGTTDKAPDNYDELGKITVQTIGQLPVPASVKWIAPHGIDLAIISAPLAGGNISEAFWDRNDLPAIGADVFAVGNPHALGWTHSSGSISQYRKQTKGAFTYQIIQTTTPLNPGNSGGGLYDKNGLLIGINTMTGDKRFAEGLGFAISFKALLDLAPATFQLAARQGNPENKTTEEPDSKN